MRVKLNKVFPLESTVEESWDQLSDIEMVAGCMPGAEITEKIDDKHYKGKVRVKIGPVTVAFGGEIDVLGIDVDKRQIHIVAAGQDSKGTSSASMDLTAHIEAGESGASVLLGDANITVNGKLASFGGRMMTQVADQILGQFADNFSAKLNSNETMGETMSAGAGQGNEINGLKIAWNVMIGFIKSLFGRSRKLQ